MPVVRPIMKQPPTLAKRTVRSLRRDLQARCFAVPKLQRNFVWDPGRAAKLLDSIYRNIPIGSLFLWEMDRKSAHLIRQSTEVLPAFDDKNRQIWFVIDGQQRLSVIHQAFEGQVRTNDKGREIDFGRLCFVTHTDANQENPSRIVYRKPDGDQYVPVRDILAPDWRRKMPSEAKWFLKRVRECRSRLLDYPIPVVTVTKATLGEIGEVFIRVNSQGMRITSTDRAIALMGTLDVRAMAEEVRQRVREEVFDLGSIDPILMGFNLVTERQDPKGDPPKLEAMARRWSKQLETGDQTVKDFKKRWHRYQEAFLTTVEYLHHNFPVHDESYLPSANMLATLAVFFFHHRGQPDRRQATEIRKWFWTTGVAQRYSGRGYHHNIVDDARLFAALALGKHRRFVFKERLDPDADLLSAEYSSRAARTRAFFCLLAANQPRYFENGEPIPLDGPALSHSNHRHRHHIFPQAQLKKFFPRRSRNGLVNICLLVSRDNLAIGKKRPRAYLTAYKEENASRFKRVTRSHLLPVDDDSGVWEWGVKAAFQKFRRQRLRLICAAFEKQARIKLFSRP